MDEPLPLVAQVMKCAVCLDKALADDPLALAADVNDAVTMAPIVQTVPVGPGRTIPFVVAVPVCLLCRKEQVTSTGNGRLFVS